MINNKAISKWFSMLLLMLVAGITGATAQSLSIGAVSIKAGETADVTVSLADGPIYGIQTDIVLPTGLTVVDNSIVSLQEGVSADGNTLTSGNYRVAVLSMPESGSATPIADGEVLKLTVQAAADFAGGSISLTGTELTTTSDGKTVIEVAAEAEPTVEVTVEEDAPGVPSVTWAMADGATSIGVASPSALATDITWSMGSNIVIDGTATGTYFDKTFTRFTNTNKLDNVRSKINDNYIEFKFTPQGGEFTPTNVSFDITKIATGDPNIWVYVIDGAGKTITLGENVVIRKSSEDTPSETQTFEVSGAASSTGSVALRIYIGKLATTKQVGIANVVISGTLIGADDPVLSATKNVALKVTPFQPSVTGTVVLTGKNLVDGNYSAPVINLAGLSIAPENFSVVDGEVNQEFLLTYAPTADVPQAETDLTFTVGELTATTTLNYQARITAYEQTTVSEAKIWNWETLTETVELTAESTPSYNDDFVFQELEEQISFGEFDARSIVISKTQFPSRNKKFQNGTIKFTTTVPGVITVDFSDTGASESNTAVNRYLNVNGTNTEYYAKRNGTSDRKVTGEIVVAAGEVAITGMGEDGETPQALCIYKVTFEPKEIVAPAAPTFSLEEGEYDAAQTVELACETEGATIYYTVNGNEPTAENTAYTEAITISETTTIKAIAIKDGVPSEVAEAAYTIIIPEPTVIYIETDLTSQFTALTNVTNWVNAIGAPTMAYAGWAAPKVTVNGEETALVESYGEGQEFKQKTGDVMYQTITGLAPGTYAIELYGAACLTEGRSGMTTDFTEGDEQALHGAYLYAQSGEQLVKTYIPCLIESNMNSRGGEEAIPTAKLEGVVVGADGSVKVGIYKELGLTNWHFVQLKSVIAQVNAFDLLASYKAQAADLLEHDMNAGVKSTLQVSNEIEESDLTEENAKELLDEFGANIDAATKSIALYAKLPDMKTQAEDLLNSKMNADVKSTLQICYDTDFDTLPSEEQENSINAFQEAIDNARESMLAYSHLRSQLDILKEALAGTNVYAPGNYEDCQTLVETNEPAYENGTITTEDAANFNIGERNIGYLPALLIGLWSSDIENIPYVNTWSEEATDGDIPFGTPFLEYWTGDGYLAANTLTAEMGGLEPGDIYTVTALVRVQQMNDDAIQGITLQVNDGDAVAIQGDCVNADEHLYLASYSATGVVGDDGVLYIKFKVADDNNVKWLALKNVWFEKTGETITQGDANLDGEVTVTDASLAVNFALGVEEPTEEQFKAADINKSDDITVSDAVGIAYIALSFGGDPDMSAARNAEPQVNYLTQDDTHIGLVNSTAFAGFQMDVTLSNGAVLNGVRLADRAQSLTLVYNQISSDTWRIVALSYDGRTISGNDGLLLSLDIMGQGSASVSHVEFADRAANAYELGFITPTGISTLYNNKVEGEVYTVSGTRTGSMKKGVNVVRQADGKVSKVLVK